MVLKKSIKEAKDENEREEDFAVPRGETLVLKVDNVREVSQKTVTFQSLCL